MRHHVPVLVVERLGPPAQRERGHGAPHRIPPSRDASYPMGNLYRHSPAKMVCDSVPVAAVPAWVAATRHWAPYALVPSSTCTSDPVTVRISNMPPPGETQAWSAATTARIAATSGGSPCSGDGPVRGLAEAALERAAHRVAEAERGALHHLLVSPLARALVAALGALGRHLLLVRPPQHAPVHDGDEVARGRRVDRLLQRRDADEAWHEADRRACGGRLGTHRLVGEQRELAEGHRVELVGARARLNVGERGLDGKVVRLPRRGRHEGAGAKRANHALAHAVAPAAVSLGGGVQWWHFEVRHQAHHRGVARAEHAHVPVAAQRAHRRGGADALRWRVGAALVVVHPPHPAPDACAVEAVGRVAAKDHRRRVVVTARPYRDGVGVLGAARVRPTLLLRI